MSPELQKARSAAIKSKQKKYIIMGIAGLVPAMEVFFIGSGLIKLLGTPVIFVVFAYLAGLVFTAFSKNRAYNEFASLYKKEIISSALRGAWLYEEMKFDYDTGLDPLVIANSGMLSINRFTSNCLLRARHNGVYFMQADVRNVRGEYGAFVTEYDGTFLIIPVNLSDAGATVIAQKGVDIGYILPGKPFTTSNPEFNKRFKVSTDTPARAAALLDNTVTSSLLSIADRISGKMLFTIKGGSMYLFLSRKGKALKPSLIKGYDDSMRENIIKELSRAKLFIDYFSQDV